MDISYDEKDDILFIKFSNEKIIKDISYGWNVNVGMTEKGIGEITVLDAKAAPVYCRFIFHPALPPEAYPIPRTRGYLTCMFKEHVAWMQRGGIRETP